MDITIHLDNADFSVEDKELLKETLGVDDAGLPKALEKLTKTAFMEYLKMFKEKGIPTRSTEVMEERLFLLFVHYFIDKIPDENQISPIFQLTTTQSKTLLRNTTTKYRTKIKKYLKATLKQLVGTAQIPNGQVDYEFICTSPLLIEQLNQLVNQNGPELKPIEKVKEMAGKFRCAPDTYNLLTQLLV